MDKKLQILTALLLIAGLAGLANSCSRGPAETAGKNIDDAVHDTKDAVRDAGHDVKHDLSH